MQSAVGFHVAQVSFAVRLSRDWALQCTFAVLPTPYRWEAKLKLGDDLNLLQYLLSVQQPASCYSYSNLTSRADIQKWPVTACV